MMELIALLYMFLFRLLARRRPVTVVFHCPRCGTLRIVKRYEKITYNQDLNPVDAIRVLHCKDCNNVYDADSFEADPSGVLHIKTWDCPQCSHLNPNSTFTCLSCGFRLT